MKEAVYEKYQIVIEAVIQVTETLALFAAGDTRGFSNLNELEPFASWDEWDPIISRKPPLSIVQGLVITLIISSKKKAAKKKLRF